MPDIGESWLLPEPAFLTLPEVNRFCNEVQTALAKWLGDDIRVTCDVLQDIEAQADQLYADDLAELDRVSIALQMILPTNPDLDLDYDFINDDFHFDAHRERGHRVVIK